MEFEKIPLEKEQVYRIIKCPLKCVLKKYDTLQPIIEQCVKDVNEIIILGKFPLVSIDEVNEIDKLLLILISFCFNWLSCF